MKAFKKLHNIHLNVHPLKKHQAKKRAKQASQPDDKQLMVAKEQHQKQMIANTKQHVRGFKGIFINLGHKISNGIYNHCYNMAYKHFFPKVTDDEYASPKKALYPDDTPKGDYDTGYNDYNALKISWLDAYLRGALSKIKPDDSDGHDVQLAYQKASDTLHFQINLVKRIAKLHLISYRDIEPLYAADKKHRAKKMFKSRRLRDDGYPTDGTYENDVENLLRNDILSKNKFMGFRKVNHEEIAKMLWSGISQDRTNKRDALKIKLTNQNKTPLQIEQILVSRTKDPDMPLSPWGSDPDNNPYNQPQN